MLHWKPRRNWKGKVSIWKSSICVHCCRSISKLFSIPSARRTKLSSSTRTLGLEVLRANWLLSFPKRRLNTSMDLFAASPRPIHQCPTARRSRSSSFLKLPMLFVWHASCTPTKFWCSVGRKRLPRNKTMAETQVKMPQMGESIFEGTVTKWLKKKGDKVQRDEPLFEISTDKIDTEIPSPASGVLQDILVKEGQTVQINTTVAIIGDGSGKPAVAPAKPAEERKPEAKEPSKPPAGEPAAQAKAPTSPPGPATVAGPTPTTGGVEAPEEEEEEEEAGRDGVRSSPLVRRIAKEHGVNLSALAGRGTGINGRI